MHSPLFADLVVLLLVSIGVLFVSHQVRAPGIIAFLVSGLLLGPHGLGLVSAVHEVEQLAEIGVILLLFTIGLEFSLADLLRMRRVVLLGGALQILGVTGVVAGAAVAAGISTNEAIFLGMIASLSSTAVVLRLFQERAEVDAPHGRVSLGILVCQDLMIVPMILLIPVLAGGSGSLGSALAGFAVKTVAALVGVVVLARFVVPQLLHKVVQTRNRDLFLLTVVTVCLTTAWAAGEAGMSLPLGAFLAGLLISESQYSHQALADILPFRDLFASFFFISIGMLLDVGLIADNPVPLAATVVGLLAVKTVAAGVATAAVGGSLATVAMTGLALSQVGEFSFVLAGTGIAAGLLTETAYNWFVAASVITMGLTPFLIRLGGPLAAGLQRIPVLDRLVGGDLVQDPSGHTSKLSGHVIIVGFSVNGRNVAHAARLGGIPHVAVDMNPTLVQSAREDGYEVVYGDATRKAFLEYLGIERAHAVVVAISDASSTRQVTALARSMNSACTIVARTREVEEVEALLELGANFAIPEELETSIEIVARLLASYLIPRAEMDAFISELRAGQYQMFRSLAVTSDLADLRQTLTDVEIQTLRVAEGSALAGRALNETVLRNVYGVSVVAVRRNGSMIPNPGGEQVVLAGDLLVLLGLAEEIVAVTPLIRGDIEASPGLEAGVAGG
ncbi:MAG: potassium transporter KefB [Gemmatimonadetes bacterium]|nr:potassium transporter KefB [Gemmatimonadota bacterium]